MTELKQLIQDCLQGKIAAQKELYELYSEQMMGVCYRYTKSVADAEDILQEAFLKVFKNLKAYRQEGELGAWIRKITVNTALNYLKRSSKYRTEMMFGEQEIHLVPINGVLQENIVDNISAKEVAALIRQLPLGYQTIFNLYAVEGYSHIEIGQMLGISDNTSRTQYFKARNLLMNWMEKKELVKSKSRQDAG